MKQKASIFLVVLTLINCKNKSMDISTITLQTNISNYLENIEVEEKREIDLQKDFAFFKMDDNGAVEAHKGKVIHDYYLDATKENIVYKDIILEKRMLIRTVDDNIIGYEVDTDVTKKSNKLFTYLEKEFGKGRLVYDNGGDSKIFIWKKDETIVQFRTVTLFQSSENTSSIGSTLVVVNENAMLAGLWPQNKKLPTQLTSKPIIINSDY